MDYKYKRWVNEQQQQQPPPMSYQHQSYFTQQAIRVGYSILPVGPIDEGLGIPQQRFQNNREMAEALGIEIEKEMRRSQAIESEITQISMRALIVPPRDDGMSVEEKLARACEKRLVEKAVAARQQRYTGLK